MNKYAAIAIVATVAASGSVHAAGFQPWTADAAASKQDAVQAVVPVGPFYRHGVPQRQGSDTAAKNQADVVFKPWYAAGRV